MKIDKKLIKELTDYLDEFNLSELEYGNSEIKIKPRSIGALFKYLIPRFLLSFLHEPHHNLTHSHNHNSYHS